MGDRVTGVSMPPARPNSQNLDFAVGGVKPWARLCQRSLNPTAKHNVGQAFSFDRLLLPPLPAACPKAERLPIPRGWQRRIDEGWAIR